MDTISFILNETHVDISDLPPTTTLLQYLRDNKGLTGTKEGCAEGDCGACTVAILDGRQPSGPSWRSVNSCLVLLPMLHGKQVFTIEGLRQGKQLHPVQESIVRHLGSQCGYCTPGVVMTLFEACYREDIDADWKLDDQLCGTLCRCTGYRPIRDAAEEIKGLCPADHIQAAKSVPEEPVACLSYQNKNNQFIRPTTLAELWSAIAAHDTYTFIGGATDLGLSVTKRHQTWPVLIGLDAISALQNITKTGTTWSVGSAVRLSDLETHMDQQVEPLARMLRFFGSRQIKNRATVGGNLCNASPIGDLAPILSALQTNIILSNGTQERTLSIDDFFLGYRQTALQSDEIVLRIEFEILSEFHETSTS